MTSLAKRFIIIIKKESLLTIASGHHAWTNLFTIYDGLEKATEI